MTELSIWPFARPPMQVQIEALQRGIERPKFGYWLEQGLGKTAVELAHFMIELMRDETDALIVVAPSYLKSGWTDEATTLGMKVPVHCWPATVARPLLPHVFVINPEALRAKGGEYIKTLLTSGLRYRVALDEPAIKNFNGAQSKNIFSTFASTHRRNELIGTPMPHDVMDLWAMLRFIGELDGVNPYAFRNKYAVLGGFKGKVVQGVRNEEQLHATINRCAFRALKSDWWADAPDKMYVSREFEMLPRQREMYRTMELEFYAMIEQLGDSVEVYADQVTHAMAKMQQISRGFVLHEGQALPLMPDQENPALKVVQAELDLTPGKAIVFAFHRHSVDMLERALSGRGAVVLRGGMNQNDIAVAKDTFNNDRQCRLMIAQTSVGSRGHTLLGQPGPDRCSTTIYFENSYDLEVRLQSEDRNHRWGQDRGVLYVDLFGSSIDRAKVDALQNRKNLIATVVDVARRRPKMTPF